MSCRVTRRLRAWVSGVLLGGLLAPFATVIASAQTLPPRWRWSNPAPHGANIFDMAYGLGVTVQVGERGQIFTSDDLVYWEPKTSGTTKSLRGVTFFGSRLVVVGETGTVLYADSLEEFQLVNLNTSDWLEGVAASTTTLVAVGDNAAIYTSTDGASWTRESPPSGATNWLRGVTFGNSVFVAVGENGFVATAPTSGKPWTQRNSGVTTKLNDVAWLDNLFWAVGDNGVVLTSVNGISWNQAAGIGASGNLFAVAGTGTNQLLAGESTVLLRENAGAWSDQLSTAKPLPARAWTYHSALWEGSLFLIAGRSGVIFEGFKTNVSEYLWVERRNSARTWLWDALRTPDFYVAVGDHGTILTSGGGVDWTLELTPGAATNSVLLGIGGTTNGLVAVGSGGTILFSQNRVTALIFTNLDQTTVTNLASTVGTFWQAVDPKPVTDDLQGVANSADLFVVTGANGRILTSPNGTNWQTQASPTGKFLSGVAAFSGGFAACGDGGTLLTSTDGVTWTPRNSGVTNWLFRVRHLNGQLVVVGEDGVILTSADGVTWTSRTSGTTRWLTDAARVANTYYVVGTQGTVLASADTITWTNVGTVTQKSLYGVTGHEGQLIAVGVEGTIVRSPLAPALDPVKFLDFDVAAGEKVFLISGLPDQRFQMQRTTNLVEWEPGIMLELLEASGTILFRDRTVATHLTAEFFRAVTKP